MLDLKPTMQTDTASLMLDGCLPHSFDVHYKLWGRREMPGEMVPSLDLYLFALILH